MITQIDYNKLIGVDETGVGDYFTPVVSVAVFVPEKNIDILIELGIKDSKKLSDKKIIQFFDKLNHLVIWKKTLLSQQGYNKLIKQNINNNEIKTLIHCNSIRQLENYLNNKVDIIIDQYTNSISTFERHIIKLQNIEWLAFQKPKGKIYLETKAEDKSISVAAASIIARKLLLDYMKEQEKKFNFKFQLGASQKVEQNAREFVEIYGHAKLIEVAKISFKTTQKIINKN
ncbi:ribonuclease HIII [Metamycoplasma equirhinis]|uniref:ribonuclease HIII n=2 Tax=Metamycoplasma equirhinis TaxID=92402 RepID=UPI0035935D44